MSEKSRKQLILAALDANLQRLATVPTASGPPHFHKVARSESPSVLEAVTPSIQYSISDESLAEGGEDFNGYVLQFDIAIKLNTTTPKSGYERYDLCDELAAVVQGEIERDTQLQGLCNWIAYLGENPFTNEVNGPLAGTVLFYRVEYRRARGRPDLNYG